MNFPPTKRPRGLDHDVVMATSAFDDPFGDDEDFTQDDLDEIDIIASQAVTSAAAGPGIGSGRPSSLSRATTKPSRQNTSGFSSSSSSRGHSGTAGREPVGDREESYSLLEAQQAELKKTLKELEEQIVLKSGEIRVLRDSLRAAQLEKEAQRQKQILLETQRQKETSDREKELNRKVQSLQSELQFKEAEINGMKNKLLSSSSPLNRNSPKVLSSLVQVHHGSVSSSSSPAGNGFITKETFGAQVPTRTTPVKTPMKTRRDADRGGSNSRQEVTRPDPFSSVRPAHLQHRGGILLGLLLQQPLSPSSLSLSHLLSMSLTSSLPTAGFLLHSDAVAASVGEGVSAPGTAPSPVQSLAVTGLNMLSQSRAAGNSSSVRCCPGAVLLLPLLDLHLCRLCRALDSAAASVLPACRTASTAAAPGRREETVMSGFSVEDTGLASLRLLHLLLAHSDEVVETVLSQESQRVTDDKTEPSAADLSLCSHNALLQSVLRLCEAGACVSSSSSSSSRGDELVLNAMKTLCVLIERTPHTHTDRLQCVLQRVCVCWSADSRLHTVSECVSVLTSMSDHQSLAQQLCSQHDACIFLKLFLYVRNRPDKRATHSDWIMLDLQVVRLLSRLVTQRAENLHSTCQCHAELVQTVVIVFHRQWLDLRASQEPTNSSASPAASLLRECLLLLHWLLLHHAGFSESCRPLLHMYDQVIPAVRDTLRRVPGLSESEGTHTHTRTHLPAMLLCPFYYCPRHKGLVFFYFLFLFPRQSWHWRKSAARRATTRTTWRLRKFPDVRLVVVSQIREMLLHLT
uniref:ATR-interacting protein n=1 Tax=Scophthalmus maximus TaxID=52904 RepID=A0A8D3E3L8_SCOMX